MSDHSKTPNAWQEVSANNGIVNSRYQVPEKMNSRNAVVEISRTGTKTVVVPRSRPDKEKFLVILIIALLLFCGMLMIMVFTRKNQSCTGKH